jgi:adenylate cyclase
MAADQGLRKVASILAADVAGYSRLMADDERATVRTLTEYREVFSERVEAHQGRVVDTAGDSVLATFDSVVEAVEAAVEIQRDLANRNAALHGHRKMHFRIGVNIGDIIIRDDGTIYGDGVNVAARLESLAEPGGIMLADVARQMVKGKLEVGLADAGEHEVKNIAEPVRAYRVLLDGVELVSSANTEAHAKNLRRPKVIAGLVAVLAVVIGIAAWGVTVHVEVPQMVMADGTPTDDPVLAVPTGPTIAVLPFENIGGADPALLN